ncbi:uncharacterized protein LOC126909037 isoform X2 [Daktulosphaira vitifoliae]|uniref:uncharacterized protein LOC126909037 isoform X2 n=1 Tax=Daktulosphaira vitifoliae TaxID=58002 RepID=UPI0021A9E51C|nr:uncharacterized protein LOC126909037 isoform X2 [Daktulosphaira vitifoliae]
MAQQLICETTVNITNAYIYTKRSNRRENKSETSINSPFDGIEKPVSLDSSDINNYRDVGIQHTDIKTSDYELSQDSIDTNIKDLKDIIQERELHNNITLEKNNYPNWIVASLNNAFMWIQKHLNRFFKFDPNLSTMQPKNQINDDLKLSLTHINKELEKKDAVIKEMEIDTKFKENQIKTLREDQKILENRIDRLVKNEIFNQNYIETLTNTIQENQSSQQKKQLEITKLNDLNNYLKNVLSTNASELDEKEDIYQNIIKSLDSKNVKLNEENISLQLETASKMSEMKILKDKIHDFQSKEQKNDLQSTTWSFGHGFLVNN